MIDVEVQITDFYPRKGRRGLDFHYVLENDKLYHVSRYAKRTVNRKRSDGSITYVLDLSELPSEWVYVFSRTNSGFPRFRKFKAKDLLSKDMNLIDVNDDELTGLKLGDLSPEFQRYFNKNWSYIVKMVESIKRSKLRSMVQYHHFHPGVLCFLDSLTKGYWWSASWPTDRARKNSLAQEMKFIHQLWMFNFVVEALGIKRSLTDYVTIEQGGGRPSIVFEDKKGEIWSGWVECQVLREIEGTWLRVVTGEGEHMVKRTVWVRADLVFAKGDWRGKEEQYGGMYWTVRDLKADLLIECKHEEAYEWWNEKTYSQLKQYIEVFRPEHALLVSLRKLPNSVKETVKALGYKAFDEVYPESHETVELIRYLERLA